MEFLKRCNDMGYALLGIDEKKRPTTSKWRKISNKELNSSFTIDGNHAWAMRMGLQDNGDHIIGLDFDIMVKNKSGKYKKNNLTTALLNEWKELNESSDGLYYSSTQNNMGNLVNIKNCPKLINLLSDIGKTRFENKKDKVSLEILCSCLCVLPPSKTVCKVKQRMVSERTFVNEDQTMLQLEPDTACYEFIVKYCTEYQNRNCKKVRQRDIRSKVKKTIYNNVKDGKYIVDNEDHALELLLLLNTDRYCYDSWWKVGMACLNTFDREVAENLFVQWSRRDVNNYDGDIPFNDWDSRKEEYKEKLNWNTIMKWVEYDAPSKFIPCIMKYNATKKANAYLDFKKKFEATYPYCKEPHCFFYKTENGVYVQRSMAQVKELNMPDIEHFTEWCSDDNKKIYEISDSIPQQHINNPNVFNIFSGYKFWEWDKDWKNQVENDHSDLKDTTMAWWKRYMSLLCGKNDEMVTYIKCLLGNTLFNATRSSRVFVLFQGIEGTGKSFFMTILHKLLGHLNVAESANAKRELFGTFNEPLLNCQVCCIDENEPEMMSDIMSELKNKITNDYFIVNIKNQKTFRRRNTIQFFGCTNSPKAFGMTTTQRRFVAVKTCSDLALQNEENERFWNFGYDKLLEKQQCLQYITYDIYNTFVQNNGFTMDFKNARPKTNYMASMIKQNIPPIYSFLQKICSEPCKLLDEHKDENVNVSFASWYYKKMGDRFHYKPLYEAGLKTINAENSGFWIYQMKNFREDLNEYTKKILDKNISFSSDEIQSELSNFFECDDTLFRKINALSSYYYLMNPQKIKTQLMKYKYYQVENEDCEKSKGKGFNGIFKKEYDEEEEKKEEIHISKEIHISVKKPQYDDDDDDDDALTVNSGFSDSDSDSEEDEYDPLN